jgi:flagellar hook protein FlgE
LFTQGSFSTTQNVTDIALEGGGFFMVHNPKGAFYTRAGNFHIDDSGYLVNPSGSKLQGYQLDERGRFTGLPVDVQIPTAPLIPKPTGDGSNAGSGVKINANLDSNATIPAAFDLADPLTTSNFATSVTVYDSLGNDHLLTVYFRKATESATGNTWEYHVVADEADANVTPPADVLAQSGTLTFNTFGQLVGEQVTYNGDPANPYFNFTGGAQQNQQIAFDFGESINEGGTGTDGTTQYGQASSVLAVSQDGYGPSYLIDISIDNAGKIFGRYTNGETRAFSQIAIANFRNVNGLARMGDNMFAESHLSGQPLAGVANEGGNGRIFSNTMELSNVDMAEEFVRMITTQRGFQANSRSIKTADELLQELVNLNR